MTKSTITAGTSFTIGPWELVVVESTKSVATATAGCLAATTMREPIAIVVRHPDGDRTFYLAEAEGAPEG